MLNTLTFLESHDYSGSAETGVVIPVVLVAGANRVRIHSKLDTGAQYCIFQREYGEELGLDIEAGELKRFSTAAGGFEAFGHDVTIEGFGASLDSRVYFSREYDFPRNVLGRIGWIRKFRIGLIDYDSMLYLSPYDS